MLFDLLQTFVTNLFIFTSLQFCGTPCLTKLTTRVLPRLVSCGQKVFAELLDAGPVFDPCGEFQMTVAEKEGTPTYMCRLVVAKVIDGYLGTQMWGNNTMTHKVCPRINLFDGR